MAVLKFTSGSHAHMLQQALEISRVCLVSELPFTSNGFLIVLRVYPCSTSAPQKKQKQKQNSLPTHIHIGSIYFVIFSGPLSIPAPTPQLKLRAPPQRGSRILQRSAPISKLKGKCQPHPLPLNPKQNGYSFITNLSFGGQKNKPLAPVKSSIVQR